jgi:shikimate 5-dehydrogenase
MGTVIHWHTVSSCSIDDQVPLQAQRNRESEVLLLGGGGVVVAAVVVVSAAAAAAVVVVGGKGSVMG